MKNLLLAMVLVAAVPAGAQQTDDDTADDAFYTVSYVEIEASSRSTAFAAFRAYESANSAINGYVGFDLFEEPNQSGRFAIIETWLNQGAFDEVGTAIQQGMIDMLDPVRVSDYDRRPYKPLSVASRRAAQNDRAIYVIAHVDVSPNPEVPLLLAQHASESRLDDGNIGFDVIQHTMRANHFTVIETWEDSEAYRSHVEANHTRAYRNALAPFLSSPLDERLYQAVD